jgi:peptide chain release factor 1
LYTLFYIDLKKMITIEDLLSEVLPRIEQIEIKMSQPDTLSNQTLMKELSREHKRLSNLQNMRERLIQYKVDKDDLQGALDDPELAELAELELPDKIKEIETLESEIRRLLVPEAPVDARDAVVEIRAGTGGDEAALFGMDLYKMYTRFFEQSGWKFKILHGNFTELGGAKEVIISVSGDGVYGRLKHESGVHRVQRVPSTETQGRVHTSAATVAVLPEAEEVDIQIEQKDLKIDTFRSSGPGGQHVNKTDSAIRMTHLPSGIVVSCQDEKSQYKNKAQALKVLRARLYQRALDEENSKRAAERKSQVSSGDRSAKIRTYNFPQARVTDHRISLSLYRLDEILTGSLELVIDPYIDHLSAEMLANVMKSN